jgi:hypothetical protein
MKAITNICWGFVAAALGIPSSVAAETFVSHLPAYPVAGQTIVLRVDDRVISHPVTIGPHTVSVGRHIVRIEGCLLTGGRSFSVPYAATLNVTLPPGDYAVEYHRRLSPQRNCQIDQGTLEFRGSGTLKVRAAGPDWPPPAGPAAAVYEYHKDGQYFITSSQTEQLALETGQLTGWHRGRLPQGFGFFTLPAPDRIPVCRFYTERFAPDAIHFHTANSNECALLKQSPVWIYEGIVAYVWPARGDGSCAQGMPLYRLFDDRLGVPQHRYIDSESDRDFMVNRSGWTAEGYGKGVVMCVPPAP